LFREYYKKRSTSRQIFTLFLWSAEKVLKFFRYFDRNFLAQKIVNFL